MRYAYIERTDILRKLPKVDIYIYFSGDEDELCAKGVNAFYNKLNDYYSIKVEDLIGKTYLPHQTSINFENEVDVITYLDKDTYFVKNEIEYTYSNIYLEKRENQYQIDI